MNLLSVVFCLLLNALILACIAVLGWMVWKGANGFLIFAMLLLALCMVIPGKDIFMCPKCGHVDEVESFKTLTGHTFVPSKKEGQE